MVVVPHEAEMWVSMWVRWEKGVGRWRDGWLGRGREGVGVGTGWGLG